jgi:biopolymer transport protein ExbD
MGRNLRTRAKRRFEEPTINLTPLIDVVFVILIMFIVVAPLLELDRIHLAEGNGQFHENRMAVQEKSPLTIHVHEDNTIWWNQERVSLEELALRLHEAKISYPLAHPQLFHDRKAQFGVYQSVKNTVELAGFTELDVILKPN